MSRRGVVGSLLVLVVVILLLHLWLKTTTPASGPASLLSGEPSNLGQGPRNSTLGFQKIFYINTPQRTDRRDLMTLMAGYLNLDFTAMEGVNGSQVATKAYPWDVKNSPGDTPNPNALGCWRAHSNIWEHMISSGISSALVFEDDADFSVGIRDIMESISQQLQVITGARNGESYGIVDGNSWDILALGHCAHQMPDPKTDPTVAEMNRVWADPYAPESDKQSLPAGGGERLRMLTISKGWACTHGYAITREGAMRLLYNVGGPGHELDRPVDLVIFEQISRGALKSFAALPSLVGQWKFGNYKDTDIQPLEDQRVEEKGSGSFIIRSVREEIKQAFGDRNIWKEMEEKREKLSE